MFVANEIDQEVFFDQMVVEHIPQLTVQKNHYYPFGLELVGLNKKGKPEHKFKYNGVENEQTFGLQWNETRFRSYDLQLGRWHQIDPKNSERESAYVGMANNPIINSDPLGDTTRVFNLKGGYLGTINSNSANQAHFISAKMYTKFKGNTKTFEKNIRRNSVAFIDRGSHRDIRTIAKATETKFKTQEWKEGSLVTETKKVERLFLALVGKNKRVHFGEIFLPAVNKKFGRRGIYQIPTRDGRQINKADKKIKHFLKWRGKALTNSDISVFGAGHSHTRPDNTDINYLPTNDVMMNINEPSDAGASGSGIDYPQLIGRQSPLFIISDFGLTVYPSKNNIDDATYSPPRKDFQGAYIPNWFFKK